MNENKAPIVLLRDCDAVLVPAGTPVNLPAGTEVMITQQLGGNVTVNIYGNLARIAAKDIDALGLDPTDNAFTPDVDFNLPLEEQIQQLLKTCYDPEIPVDIVELGLIYNVALRKPSAEELAQHTTNDATHPINYDDMQVVEVTMTLTAPGCGFGPVLMQEVESKLNTLPGVLNTDIELVFEPPWSPESMSEAARLELNLF